MPVKPTMDGNATRPETAALARALASSPAARRFHFRATTVADQVRADIMARIDEGEWVPGQAIPGEHDLAREYNIATVTMRKLLDAMQAEGLVERAHGRGTFVRAHPPWEEMAAKHAALLAAAVGAVRPTDNPSHRTVIAGLQDLTEEHFLVIARQATLVAGWLNRRARLAKVEAAQVEAAKGAEPAAALRAAARAMREGAKGAVAKAGRGKAGKAA